VLKNVNRPPECASISIARNLPRNRRASTLTCTRKSGLHGTHRVPSRETPPPGRTRWKIENEGFNVMKNHGYEFEHNFGHGARFLAMTLASLHTVLELLEPPWIAAREAAAKRTSFFAHLATLTAYAIFPSWPVFLEALATFTIPPDLLKTQKSNETGPNALHLELLVPLGMS
jgi:hypothetical protein